MAKTSKGAKQSKTSKGPKRRQERRFSTSTTFMPVWVAIVGMLGSLALGSGIFSLWILDPPAAWATYLVAAGGSGLAVALWFGQASESAVTVGDSGVGVEDGQDVVRVSWYLMRSLHVNGGFMVVEGDGNKLKFLLGANQRAAAYALKEAATRVPDIIDVDKELSASLPDPSKVGGYLQELAGDQLAGMRCASSDKLIHLEEEARICPQCGQIFHKEELPEKCPSCDAALKGQALIA